MKKQTVFSLCGSLLLLGAGTLAAPPKPDFDTLAEELNLSGSDRQAFVEVMQRHRVQREAIRDQAEDQGYQHHKAMRQLREEHRGEIRSLLGEEQFEAFEKNMWRRHRQGQRGPRERGFKW